MKKNFKTYVLLALGLFMAGCSEDDKPTVNVQETVTSGAILRTLSKKGALDMFDTSSALEFSIQEQDAEGGELLDAIGITVSFVDKNKDRDGDDGSVANAALATVNEFGEHEGLPSFEYRVTLEELLKATGIALTDVLPGDQFVIDMELFLTDGRSFKNSDATGNVSGGSFFSSPFRYVYVVDDGIAFGLKDRIALKENDAKEGDEKKKEKDVENDFRIFLNASNNNEEYSVKITIDDKNKQSLVETLNLYRAFVDRNIVDDVDQSEAEALFMSWNIADLEKTEEGVSTLDYMILLDDLYGDDLTFEDLGLNDEFLLRYEIVTTDGRVVTTDKKGSEYFSVVLVTEAAEDDDTKAAPPGTLLNDSFISDLINDADNMEFGPDGKIYIVNSGIGSIKGTISQYDPSGKLLNESFIPDLTQPQDMEFGPDGNLYVLETGTRSNTGRISLYSTLGILLNGSFVPDIDLNNPHDMEFGPDGNLYVLETSSNKISLYSPSGALLEDSFISGLDFPIDMEFGPDGNLYVANFSKRGAAGSKIQRYSASGTLDASFMISGLFPEDTKLGPDGNLYIVSSDSIKKYGPLGTLLEDSFISGLNNPGEIEFGPDGNLYVILKNGRDPDTVQQYAFSKEATTE